MRVLSYNIHKGIGGRDRLYRLERIVQVIAGQQPDIICLQEVDYNVRRSQFHDQPQKLAESLEAATSLYQMNVPVKNGGYGNLVLSRWPIHTQHAISLRLRRKKPRGVQLAIVETPQGPLHLANWHLGLLERERQWQVRYLLGHKLFEEGGELPTLVIGDYNDWRNQLERKVFREHNFEQVTAPPVRFRSFPAYLPVGSLDKAFVRGGVGITSAKVVKNRVAKNASDHLPLVLDIRLPHNTDQK